MHHAQDLLDYRTIEKNGFVPALTIGSVSEAINEIVTMLCQTLTSNKVDISYITRTRHNKIMFDKTRL